jgi:hypothetical protein
MGPHELVLQRRLGPEQHAVEAVPGEDHEERIGRDPVLRAAEDGSPREQEHRERHDHREEEERGALFALT